MSVIVDAVEAPGFSELSKPDHLGAGFVNPKFLNEARGALVSMLKTCNSSPFPELSSALIDNKNVQKTNVNDAFDAFIEACVCRLQKPSSLTTRPDPNDLFHDLLFAIDVTWEHAGHKNVMQKTNAILQSRCLVAI